MEFCILSVVNVVSAYFELGKHVIIELGTTFHKSIRSRVVTIALARNSRKKSLIIVIIVG